MALLSVNLSDSIGVVDSVEAGCLVVSTPEIGLVQVVFPEALRLETLQDQNFRVTPVGAGVPVGIVTATAQTTQVSTGVTAYALAPNDSYDGQSEGVGDVGSGLTNVLDLAGVPSFDSTAVGDYISLANGTNQGRFRIIAVGWSDLTPLDPRLRLYLDRPISLQDPVSGHVESLVTVIAETESTVTVRFDHPSVTPSSPLVELTSVFNFTNGHRANLQQLLVVTPAVLLTYNTVRLTRGEVFVINEGDRVQVRARIAPRLEWVRTRGALGVQIETSRLTAGAVYQITSTGLVANKTGHSADFTTTFNVVPGVSYRPRVTGATYNASNATVFVQFNQDMRVEDSTLTNPADYGISGPSTVRIDRVYSVNPSRVGLVTSGFTVAGSYTLTVSTSTPKDVAGNPMDPGFNTAVFTAALAETPRSVFTDRGPIAKPPLTIQSGSNATLLTYNTVQLPAAVLSVGHIGKYVRLTGGSLNGGSFRIASVLTTTRARLANASFTLPDPDSGTLAWTLYDPRHGQIADDPSDVTVRVNGSPVTPTTVVGLLGQVVLPTIPGSGDDVKIDYSWVSNPTVEIRRLNSKEFRLNAWNRNGAVPDGRQHTYRYNNVLADPAEYVADDMSAALAQPELRELHYRAYERAYTPVLNDPSTLLLNSPMHRVAYADASRPLTEQFVAYEGTGLPESLVVNPWVRKGTGTATSFLGQLTVVDTTTGPFPTGEPIFWTRPIDTTFRHAFAMSWRVAVTATPTLDGVWTGIAAGYSDSIVALVVGYVISGGVKKVGVLKRGFGNDPSSLGAWTGGLDGANAPTGAPANADWAPLRSYRVFRDTSGTIRVFLDGDVVETLRVTPDELPFLEELSGPFDQIQGTFFGSLSRPAASTSTWDHVRYLIQPTNPTQTGPASYVSYEANTVPEMAGQPWTPVGFHGTETVQASDFLLLDSTSATDAATEAVVGLIGGDLKAFTRFEPLLTNASELVVDAKVQLLTHTHGPNPDNLAFAVDDGSRLMQVSFFPYVGTSNAGAGKISYGGRSFPEDFSPFAWQTGGTAPVQMVGRYLRIEDGSASDGRVYFYDDAVPSTDPTRAVWHQFDYILEFRCRVVSYTPDGSDFAGVFAQAFDSTRVVGAMFEESSGTRYVSFQSDGVSLGQVAFDWADGVFHTYRLVKSTGGATVSLFIDGTFYDSLAYASFTAPPFDPIGQVSFGSSTAASQASLSVVEWAYTNAWRVHTTAVHRYVGIWKGSDRDSLLGYHLPLKASGRNAVVNGNGLSDPAASFLAAGVAAGDKLIVDTGGNRKVYEVGGVSSGTTLTITEPWPAQPSNVDYRIVRQTDWSAMAAYRLQRTSTGEVNLYLDADPNPIIEIGYNSIDLPESGVGVIRTVGAGLPTIAFGSFDPENLAQSKWDWVRYGVTRAVTEQGIAPHHQVLNQRNVMSSPERLFTALPHTLTNFWSSSTGIVPKKVLEEDFLADPALPAWTQLNEGTPLVPSTQTWEVRRPTPVEEFVSGLNRPEDVLNNDGDFVTNDGSRRIRLLIPDDVLYTSLDVIEQITGDRDHIAPFDDDSAVTVTGLQFTKETCLVYDADVLPENDTAALTPWSRVSDNPAQVTASVAAGTLTYGTGGGGTKTVYRNETPLPDAVSLPTEVRFRLRLLNDTSLGTGETRVMFGLSAPGMTLGLTFLTTTLGERLLLIKDVNNGATLGSASLDFLDGNYHTYRIRRDPCQGLVQVFID